MKAIPVALVCYNRPWHTFEVLKALEEHDIQNLFIFSDAPKTEKDVENVLKTRSLFTNITWTKPEIILRKENQGLAKSIVSAVNYAFEKYDRIILLEDDCVPRRYFFEYIEKCLTKYEDNERIFGINGYTVPIPPEFIQNYPYDIYFYPRIGSWGWATWKRAWEYFEPDLQQAYDKALQKNIDLTIGGQDISPQVQRFLKGDLRDVWTLNWVLSVYVQHGFYIYPTTSHINNIGCDGTGVHSGKSDHFATIFAKKRTEILPNDIIINQELINNYNRYFGGPDITPDQLDEYVALKNIAPTPSGKIHAISQKQNLSIVHINTHDVAGGAAKVAWRLAEAQRNAGHNARLLVGYKTSNSEHSFSFPIEVNPSLQAKCLREGQLFYEFQGSHKLINNPIVESADILHFHNLHGNYFNPFSISALSHIKPVIWTLHDMQSITGHCAHSFDCERWLTGCGSCPYLQTEPALSVDTSAQLWRDKKLIYDHSYLWIVTPSQWLKSKVEKGILQNHPVDLIYNGLATDIFKPYDKREVRSKLGIPEDVLAIGSVGHGGTLANQWKGGQYIQAALDILWQKHKNVIFLNIGGSQIYSDKRYINTGHIEDENVLAQYYSCLDVFLYTPIADNCPLTILEALSCGVPIVSFNTGGIPELVRDSVDGYLVGDKNVSQLVQLIEKLASHEELRAQYSKHCRDRAISTFDNKIIADQYENIYKKCIDKYSAPLKTIKTFTLSRLPEVINTPSFVKAEISKYLHSDSDGKAMHDLVKSFDEYASVTQKKYQEYESELAAAASDLIQLQKEKLEKLYIIEKAAKIMCELLYKAGADLGQFAEIFKAQKVDFGTDEASRFLLSGWGDNETLPDEGFTFNWAIGKAASLFLVLPQEKQCQMTAHIKSLEFSKPQIITIKIDGKQMGHWQLTNKWQWEEQSIQIDPDDNRPSVSIIEFEFSQNLKADHESRPLAVLFESLTLSTMR